MRQLTKEEVKELNELNQLSNKIIGAAIEVHKELGPGLLESVYEECLAHELRTIGLCVETQVALPIKYKGVNLDKEYRIDVLVDKKIIIELKSVEELKKVNEIQLVTYLKMSGVKMGLLINFNVPKLVDGIKRKINGFI